MTSNIVSVTKHKYKWKAQEIFSIVLFAAIPVALAIFTNVTLTASLGSICGAIAVFLIYIGFARKKASELTANIFDDGSVQVLGKVTGQEYEDNNRIVIRDVTSVKWEKYAHHPTLRLFAGAGRSLLLPRRVAEEEPLNSFLRANLSKSVYVVDEAKETLKDILEDNSTDSATQVEESHPVTAAVSLAEIDAAEKVLQIDKNDEEVDAENSPAPVAFSPASDLSNLNGMFGGGEGGVNFESHKQEALEDADDEEKMKFTIVQEAPVEERKVQPRKRSRPKNND